MTAHPVLTSWPSKKHTKKWLQTTDGDIDKSPANCLIRGLLLHQRWRPRRRLAVNRGVRYATSTTNKPNVPPRKPVSSGLKDSKRQAGSVTLPDSLGSQWPQLHDEEEEEEEEDIGDSQSMQPGPN